MFGHKNGKVENELQSCINILDQRRRDLKGDDKYLIQYRLQIAEDLNNVLVSLVKIKNLSGKIHDLVDKEL